MAKWIRTGVPRTILSVILSLIAICCIIPFIIILSSSVSDEMTIIKEGFQIFPTDFSWTAYKLIFQYPEDLLRAYGVTIVITASGAAGGLLITSLIAYTLSRREFIWRGPLNFYVFFTMLFNGGLVPYYILVANVYDLKGTLWALILPLMVNAWNVLIMRTFFVQIPEALIEAARIEGAGEYRIFFRIMIPLSTPVFATIGLFLVMSYWNDWFQALLFIDDRKQLPLQYLLYNVLRNAMEVANLSQVGGQTINAVMPTESLKMATVVLTVAPMTIVFLSIQRYFVRGITIGSVKG
ncbi:carbohydrate ABC transporter permease [Cohnella phaseoli]|uniref:Putative aldouronate transport system permease protein n=1 Tax=Cohnella phaseoli TaxID=456490 RepID=A0A3D9JQD7_9BACL|nr:carbohydrate ABC transporter permease [Cohnella phaseoli]RED76333.1 putative aldouronate transport system permease protein [Cohnella phaseoli]